MSAERSWTHRNGFSDAGLSLIWLLFAFILFQATATLVAVALVVFKSDIGTDFGSLSGGDPATLVMTMMTERLDLVFIGNSVGQILFLGLATFLLVRLHTDGRLNRREYLRFGSDSSTPQFLLATAVLFIMIQPVIWLLGHLNSLIPMPELFTDLQKNQYEMIEGFLRKEGTMALALINVALVPSICEEVLFRGYLFRSFERSFRTATAIVFSGLLFGLFHLQLPNLLPLSALGVLLAIVTWASNSLWPAILAHLINNAGGVLLAKFFPDTLFTEMSAETMPPIWMVALSVIFSGILIRWMIQNRSESQKE